MQALVESLLSEYPNILVLRVRMPIVGDLTYPRNFIAKIIKYEKVRRLGMHASASCLLSLLRASCMVCITQAVLHCACAVASCRRLHALAKGGRICFMLCHTDVQVINIPNSMTVLPELLPYSIEMVRFAPMLLAQPAQLQACAACREANAGWSSPRIVTRAAETKLLLTDECMLPRRPSAA